MDKFKKTFIKELEKYEFESILDVGCGKGQVSEYFINKGKKVSSTTLCPETYEISKKVKPTICGVEDLTKIFGKNQFDVVWLWNVLEHVPNLEMALKNVREVLKENGRLIMAVPEYEEYVNGGHLMPGWNIGYLMYVLLIHGFDIKKGKFLDCNREIVAIVQKGKKPKESIRHDFGDINILKNHFPIEVFDGFNGKIKRVNWDLKYGEEIIIKLANIWRYFKRNFLKRW